MLHYLFEVEYRDGTKFEQNPGDSSATRPGGSAFSDVRVADVARFHLVNQERENDVWTVDLEGGRFEHNFRPFLVEAEPFPKTAGPRKLVFWRVKNENFHVGPDGIDARPFEVMHVAYIIGWEQKDRRGENAQKTVTIPV